MAIKSFIKGNPVYTSSPANTDEDLDKMLRGDSLTNVMRNYYPILKEKTKSIFDGSALEIGSGQLATQNREINADEKDFVAETGYGVSGTDLSKEKAGALPKTTTKLDPVTYAKQIADSLYDNQTSSEPDWGVASLLYFSKMAELASQPGATALGAAGAAGTAPAAYLMQKEKEKAAREDKKSATIAALVPALVKANNPKLNLKSMGAGDAINYMSESEARQYLKNKGLSENAPTFARLVNQISTDDESMHGSPLVISGKPAEINFSVRNGKIFDANITQIKGSEKTDYANYKTKKLQEIAKKDGDYINKITTFLPRIKTAMNVLLDPNVKTGGIEGALLPAKQFLKSMFGFKDEDLQDQEFLRSVSFSLAPLMRPAGSGSTSDMEFKAYQQAILDLGNSKFANYLNLYSLKKMTENSLKLNQLETELLVSPKNYSKEYINKKIKEFDTGIFDKFKVLEKDDQGKLIDIYESDEEKTTAYKAYWANLPTGSVFRNSDENGQKIVLDAGPYMIKGLK